MTHANDNTSSKPLPIIYWLLPSLGFGAWFWYEIYNAVMMWGRG